jgi:3-methyladenine DNA glycosylase AlkC
MDKAAITKELVRLAKLAGSDDWSTREEGGFGVRDLMEQQFDQVFALTKAWVSSKSERLRRGACLACMQRKKFTDELRVRKLLTRLRHLMQDESLYVRKCCGPFVVGYLGYTYPRMALPWLRRQARSRHPNVRTNVAKAFSQALGRQQPEAALEILIPLLGDPKSRVRQAVMQSLRNVRKSSLLTDHQRKRLSAYTL